MQNNLHWACYHNFKERQTVTLHLQHPPPLQPQSGLWCSQLHGCKKLGPHPALDKCQWPCPWCPRPQRDKVRSEGGLSGLGVKPAHPSPREGKQLNPSDSNVRGREGPRVELEPRTAQGCGKKKNRTGSTRRGGRTVGVCSPGCSRPPSSLKGADRTVESGQDSTKPLHESLHAGREGFRLGAGGGIPRVGLRLGDGKEMGSGVGRGI